MLGNLSPFGASFAAAVPKKYLLSALAGTGLGYILLTPSDSFRYIAVVVAIGGIRWLTSDIKRVKNSALFAPLVAFLPILATGVVLTFVSTSTLSSLTDCIIEAVLAGTAAYFFSSTVRLSTERRSIAAFSQQETASLVLTGCVLMLSFGSVAIEGISVGRILAVLVTLLCARYGGLQAVLSAELQREQYSVLQAEIKALSVEDTHLADLWQDCFRLSANLPA